MILFPAIDIKDNKCVRLTQGKFDKVEVYSDDPAEMAKKWEAMGAGYLHVVDLDGAKNEGFQNRKSIEKIAKAISIPMQTGGGIRSEERIKDLLNVGVNRVIVGTMAIENIGLLTELVKNYKDHIAVSIDALNGKVATRGWQTVGNVDSIKICTVLESIGIKTIVYTDISKDGMLSGPNFDIYRELSEKMITELEEKQKSLSNLKSQINEGDFGKFYSDPLERRIDEILMRLGESDYHIPEEMVQRVRYHIDIYSGRMKNVITRYLERKEKYFPMIHKVFREKNLPLELSYVSMLESGFNTMALSHAGARGLWQFMPHTGRRYGLKVNDKIDDRTDPLKSTYAAAEYFKDLISIFGGKSSVMLCMAAYNAGEGRVIGALRKIEDPMRNRDFWYIYRMGYLAEETNEYIPRVISLMIISENPDEYGFGKGPSNNDSQLESENDFIEVDLTID